MKFLKVSLISLLFLILAYVSLSLIPDKKIRAVRIGDDEFSTEIADTREEKERGLSEREKICDKCAMLFPFDDEDMYAFWMKGMRFDIDIVWVRDNKIIGISKNISRASTDNFFPPSPADVVIELNAGSSDRYGLAVDDDVFIK